MYSYCTPSRTTFSIYSFFFFFFFNDTATTEIYTLSLHDALPIAVPARRRAARRPPHGDRPRAAPLREPRVLQRRARPPGPRRVQRTHHRPTGCPANRLEADQQQPAAVDRGARRQPAAARDPRGRREVHARLHGRSHRPAAAVLPPEPPPLAGNGARPPHLRLRHRDPGPHAGGGGAVAARLSRAHLGCRRGRRAAPGRVMLDAARIRARLPLLEQQENGHRLVYLDNAATTQKPQAGVAPPAHHHPPPQPKLHPGAHHTPD